MTIKVYTYPRENSSFQDEFLFATNNFISYTYTKKFCGTGNFTLVLPATEKNINKIIEDDLINIDEDWLIVNNIKRDNDHMEITGTDLNGWLDLRITVFGKVQVAGARGYDVVKGTTGECVNHYIINNATNPTDSNRKFPRLAIGQTAQGKSNDSYMARLQSLAEVVGSLCKNATIGYEITADIENNKFIFNTIVGTNRSVEQSVHSKVIFTQKNGSLFSASYERGNADLLNTIYATGADVTQTVYRDDIQKVGVLRRESAIDVSVSTVSDIKDYALAQCTGNILTNSYELDIRAIDDYNKKYKLGDYVTVKDVVTKEIWTAQIEEMTKTISASEQKISLVIGDAKTKLLNKIQNSANISIKSETSKAANAVDHATNLITGNVGGYVLIHLDDETQKPYEILIMDNEDYKLAKNIWRWNKQGFGHTSNGYEGPYDTAITMSGYIIASFIVGGILKSLNGNLQLDLDNGVLTTFGDEGSLLINAGEISLRDKNNTDICRTRVMSDGTSEMSADRFQVYHRNGTVAGGMGRDGSTNEVLVRCDNTNTKSISLRFDNGTSIPSVKEISTDIDSNGNCFATISGYMLKPIAYTTASGEVIRYWGW